MLYHDQIYGKFEIPPFFEELMATKEFQRLKGISQDSLPRECNPFMTATRFEHCVGVYHLSQLATKNAALTAKETELIQISALLHDAGNAPFSHLTEPFLKKLTGKNGESFLQEQLSGTVAENLINLSGFTLNDVVKFVTGNSKPFSDVVNGSMDTDNLDNVGRYWFCANDGKMRYDAEFIARNFRFKNNEWALPKECFAEARQWQKTRKKVYKLVYQNPHLAACMMLYRAVGIAFCAGEIKEYFFNFTDNEAIDFLLCCNSETIRLAGKVLQKKWYTEILALETCHPSKKLQTLLNDWNARHILADWICKKFNLPKSAICVYLGMGKDRRRITLPFVKKNSKRFFDKKEHKPIFRMKIYIDPEFDREADSISRKIKKEFI